jgi:hypothetical protein
VEAPAGPAVFDCTLFIKTLKPTTSTVWVDKCVLNFTLAHGSICLAILPHKKTVAEEGRKEGLVNYIF